MDGEKAGKLRDEKTESVDFELFVFCQGFCPGFIVSWMMVTGRVNIIPTRKGHSKIIINI